ncbi:MAG TPA: CPBP family intramembrane glutamic endopeptidase [Myxococcales bacterium]|nr:CPBP family intramembrane glutamic endopeptidase [Myxococcales bacterium]
MDGTLRRAALIFLAAAAYAVGFWPSHLVRDAVLRAFGNPPYRGVWLLIPHLFLYTTLQALVCFGLWSLLARAGWMPRLQLSLRWRTFAWGLAAGLVSVALTVAFFFATGQAGAFHAPRVDAWNAAANVFSNFFEEYVYRGFILSALTAALGFWPAALLSSIAFAATHQQYPSSLQALIAVVAILWAWVGKRTGGLLAPYTAHMTLDWILDPII